LGEKYHSFRGRPAKVVITSARSPLDQTGCGQNRSHQKAVKLRKIKRIAVLALLLLSVTQVVWAGPQDFKLINRTGVDIYAVYVGPTSSEEWGDDLMEGTQILNGGEIEIVFAPDEDIELWDIMVEDQEGNALYWREINLLEASEIILEPDETARIK
jgi:hypothetical protein